MLSRSLAEGLGGFIAYTLSRSERSFGAVRGPSGFDRPHVLNAAVGYGFGNGYRAGLRSVVYSGTPVEVAYAEVARAPPRGPAFFRLDVRFDKRWSVGEAGAFVALVLEVQNATLSREVFRRACNAFACKDEVLGPITLPSLGLEGGL
jgi:hypothetical protein